MPNGLLAFFLLISITLFGCIPVFHWPPPNLNDAQINYMLLMFFGAWAAGVCLGVILGSRLPNKEDDDDEFPFK